MKQLVRFGESEKGRRVKSFCPFNCNQRKVSQQPCLNVLQNSGWVIKLSICACWIRKERDGILKNTAWINMHQPCYNTPGARCGAEGIEPFHGQNSGTKNGRFELWRHIGQFKVSAPSCAKKWGSVEGTWSDPLRTSQLQQKPRLWSRSPKLSDNGAGAGV